MKNIDDSIEESYNRWRDTRDLDDMTPHQIYEAAYRHGAQDAEKEGSAAALAAIGFAITTDDGIEFLRLWEVGDFDAIRAEWPDCPNEVFPAIS